MADKLHFTLVSPERELISEDVDMVEAPGVEGIFGVLPNHAPLMTVLSPGIIKVKSGGDERRIFVAGGFAEVSPAGLTILAEEAIPIADLTAEMLAARVKIAESALARDFTSADDRLAAEDVLIRLKSIQSAH